MAKDLFSNGSDKYARYRPVYPEELYSYIFSFVKNFDVAWDCATGNGQAATALAKHFNKVIATDISPNQIEHAVSAGNIEYIVAPADNSTIPDNSVDLVTVAQAYHWLDPVAFKKEVQRVCKPGGVIAIWMYSNPITGETSVDHALSRFYRRIVGPYWDPARKLVDDHYTTVSFEFEEMPSREFEMELSWKKEDLLNYVATWSAVKGYLEQNNSDPLPLLEESLSPHWQTDIKKVVFPIDLRIGRVVK